MEELIKGVAKEEGINNIRANSIAIGVIETGIFLRLKEQGVFDDAWIEGVKSALRSTDSVSLKKSQRWRYSSHRTTQPTPQGS